MVEMSEAVVELNSLKRNGKYVTFKQFELIRNLGGGHVLVQNKIGAPDNYQFLILRLVHSGFLLR